MAHVALNTNVVKVKLSGYRKHLPFLSHSIFDAGTRDEIRLPLPVCNEVKFSPLCVFA